MTVRQSRLLAHYRILLLGLALLLVAPINSPAAEIHVPSQFSTIQAAIDSSADGDTIIVQPGTYAENIDYNGKAITLTSTNPLDAAVVASTIIDGNLNGSVVTFDSGETPNSVLTGFTIRNGSGTLINGKRYGGGIYCGFQPTPTIARNKIMNNTADVGGAIYIYGNTPPTITAGPNVNYPYASIGQSMALSVTATDPDGDPLVYRWVPREGGTITGTGSAVSFSAATAGAYHIDLTVDDQHGGTATGTVSVTVIGIGINTPVPALTVGQPATVSATLTPVVANSQGYPVSVTWSLTEGPAAGTFDAAVNGTPQAVSISFTPTASGPGRIQAAYRVGTATATQSVAIALNPVAVAIAPSSGSQGATVQAAITGNNLGRVSSVNLSGTGVTATIRDGKTENFLPVQFIIAADATPGNRTVVLTTPEGQFTTPVTFQINAVLINHAPVAQDQSVTTNQNTAKAITLVATDADGDPLTYQIVAQPAHGTLSGTAPNVTYAPAAGYAGSDSFTFKANDGKVDSNTATILITVNHAPVAQDQNVTAYQDTAKAITLVATDADGNPLTYQIVAQTAHGTLSGTPPNITYTPAAGYAGSDSFTFKANDGMADSNVATVSITVTQVSGPGFVYRKAITIDHTKVSATLSNFPVLVSIANDNDLKNHVTSQNGYDVVFIDSNGTLLDHELEKWDGATGTLVAWVRIPSLSSTSDTAISMLYGNTSVTTSQENKTGVWDSNFKGVWHLKDPTNPTDSTNNGNNGTNNGATAAAGEIDGAGSFGGTGYITFNQGALENVFASGSPWTISLWVMLGGAPQSWEWIWCKAYTSHNDPYYQIDLKQYPSGTIAAYIWSTSYGTGPYLSQQASVTSGVWSKLDVVGQGGGTSPFLSLYVNGNLIGTNSSPNGSYANYSTPITLGMDANIIGSYYAFTGLIDESRISNVARSADWILTEYRNQNSSSTFYGIASEGPGGPVNLAPVAQNQSIATNHDTAKAITLVATDPNADPLTYQIVTQPAHGTLSGTPPNVTYTPATGYAGSDSFTFKANDGRADSNIATVSVKVNHEPVAQDQSVTTDQDTPKAITLLATDADGDSLTYQIVAQPAHGTLSGTPPNVTFTPAAGYFGSDGFTFKANDGMADSNVATASITVTQVSGLGFLYRKAITIDHTKVSATLSNFPVLVSIANDNDLKSHVTSPSGYDIVFIDSNGTQLDHELEKWDGATGTVVAWVRVPSLSSTADTVISMLYGSAGVTTSQENKTGVWDSSFKGVWHLRDGTTFDTAASNSGGNSFSVHGVAATGGQVDGAAAFVRSSSTYLSQNSDSNNNISGDITVSLWLRPTYTLGSGEYCTPIHKDQQYSMTIFSNGISWADGTNWSYANFGYFNIGVQNNVWQYLVATKTGTTVTIYLNGLQQVQKSFGSTGVNSSSNPLMLGTYNASSGYYGGYEDEVRLSNIARSAGWILTEYRNQSSPSTFYGVGNEGPGGPANHIPVAQNQSVIANVDTAKAITLVATDVDGDPLTYQIVTQPSHGTLSGTPPNVTYTPAAAYSGSDNFTFKANDGKIDSFVSTVSIAVMMAINCGQDLSGSITSAGQRNSYTFAGSAGDVVTIRARETVGYPLVLYMELYGPTGALVGSASASSYALAELDKTLTATGTYTIVVRDSANVNTGPYTLTWEKLNGPCGPTVLSCGQVVMGTIGVSDQMNPYTLTVGANDVVTIRASRTSGSYLVPRMELYDAAGVLVASAVNTITQTFTTGGTYTVFVRDDTNYYTGGYAIEWQSLINPCGATVLACNQVVSGTIGATGGTPPWGIYSFTASVNDAVTVRANDLTGYPFSVYIELYDPAGALMGSASSTTVAQLNRTLTATGTYTVLLRDSSNIYTGNYNLIWQKPGCP